MSLLAFCAVLCADSCLLPELVSGTLVKKKNALCNKNGTQITTSSCISARDLLVKSLFVSGNAKKQTTWHAEGDVIAAASKEKRKTSFSALTRVSVFF